MWIRIRNTALVISDAKGPKFRPQNTNEAEQIFVVKIPVLNHIIYISCRKLKLLSFLHKNKTIILAYKYIL
jgi:hypothetical protein